MYAKLLSILLLITIVVITGCTSQNNSGTTVKSLTEHLTAQRISELNGFCEKSISPEKCKILISGNTNSCEILEETDRSDCFREFAVLSENPALCEKIADEQISDRCNGELFSLLKDPITLAVSSGDISKCDSYYDPSLCYIEVAHALKDSSICEKVSLLK